MALTHTCWTVAGMVSLVAAMACGSVSPEATRSSPEPVAGGPAAHSARAETRADSAGWSYTAADVHFMSAMIGHHAQAIMMAGMAPTHGASASVRTLAERIVNGQQDEIATMQQWLRDRGRTVPEARATGAMAMHGAGHSTHDMLMPGMLTEAQLKQLDQARGTEFDRLFLNFMIQHHRGAVSMVKDLFGSQGAAQDDTVFKFASDVNVDQITEIARMERMLVALLLESPSP